MICGWLKTNLENTFPDCLYSDVGLVHSISENRRGTMFLFLHWDKQHLSPVLFCVLRVKLSDVVCKEISAAFCRFLIGALTHTYAAKTW